tara:strand:+ start:1496 stop:2026 length:531 start_codon:yes stop_codon:yes gene_type:complete
MKKILILLFFIFIASCGDKEEIIPLEKISDSKTIFTIQDFKSIKFKESKKYNIDLPGIKSAFYGFIKNDLNKSEEFEIRFYESHQSAVDDGKKYADNITGKNGCIKKDCSFFIGNLKHRQKISEPANVAGGAGNGIPIAKYLNYVIYGNFILMCPGYDESEALKTCTITINRLNQK